MFYFPLLNSRSVFPCFFVSDVNLLDVSLLETVPLMPIISSVGSIVILFSSLETLGCVSFSFCLRLKVDERNAHILYTWVYTT